jgi:hypothetical protein
MNMNEHEYNICTHIYCFNWPTGCFFASTNLVPSTGSCSPSQLNIVEFFAEVFHGLWIRGMIKGDWSGVTISKVWSSAAYSCRYIVYNYIAIYIYINIHIHKYIYINIAIVFENYLYISYMYDLTQFFADTCLRLFMSYAAEGWWKPMRCKLRRGQRRSSTSMATKLRCS